MGIGERTFVGLLGLLLLGLGIYVLFFGALSTLWRCIGGLPITAIGVNSAYGAIIGKRPWLSKLGPLP